MSKLYESYGDLGMSPSSKDILEALLHLLGLYSEVFLIVDALDERSDDTRWGIIQALRSLTPNVCILILSRPRGDIGEDLKDFKKLEVKANKAGIELFIDAQIQKNSNLRRIVERSPSLRGDIKEGVVRTAREMCAHHPNVKSISTSVTLLSIVQVFTGSASRGVSGKCSRVVHSARPKQTEKSTYHIDVDLR